jgi:hypothetical protein
LRQSRELQREHARDLICAWALATEAILGACDPDRIEAMFDAAREAASDWSDERRERELQDVVEGRLTAAIFNPEFVRAYRQGLR